MLSWVNLSVFLSFARKRPKWTVYMTGTSFTIFQFRSELDGISVVRGSTALLPPTKMFEVVDMMEILQYYFHIADIVRETLQIKLQLFRERSLFLVKGVLEPL